MHPVPIDIFSMNKVDQKQKLESQVIIYTIENNGKDKLDSIMYGSM